MDILRKKTQDFQTSLNRFTDLGRDPVSRTKHFKNVFDALNTQERKQLIAGFGFEIFHLIDSLFGSHYDSNVDPQTIADIESALWMLEQVFYCAPELVGKGWQKNGIEFVLKIALHPQNVLAVRKLAIRLFIIWFQELANFGQTNRTFDLVFQCCLPHFPLRNRQQTEQLLALYCEGASSADPSFNASANDNGHLRPNVPFAARALPIVQSDAVVEQTHSQAIAPSPSSPTKLRYRERAQNLQVYMDKFLEYTTRETTKIDWAEHSQQLDCAKFILDRVIVLYIYEVFPDAEANGIDVFGGWEGTFDDESAQILDTIDPIVISRYWLIRWMTNIASESRLSANAAEKMPAPGLALFKQALFSSQKATNVLLTLMREAFRLPLACINVIQKVLALLRHWLLQREFPPFVESGLVSIEAWSVLLIHMLFSFFRSPYLLSTGDSLHSAISITHSILQIVRDLANPSSTILARPLSKIVWRELIKELSSTVELATSKSDAFGQATTSGFTRTLLSVYIFVGVIREIEIDHRMWDDALAVFRTGVWGQMLEQWARVVDSMTRALVLNLFEFELIIFLWFYYFFNFMFAIDIGQRRGMAIGSEEIIAIQAVNPLSETTSSNGSCRHQYSRTEHSSENGSAGGAQMQFLCEGIGEDDERSSGTSGGAGEFVQGLVQSTGNVTLWLHAWMRVLSLADPSAAGDGRHRQQLAVQTIGRAIDTLTSLGCADQLALWLCAHLLRLPSIAEQPHAIAILCGVLIAVEPPPLERAYILYHLLECLRREELAPLVLDHIPAFRDLGDMAVISTDTIATLQKLVRNKEFSSRAIRVASLLSLNHPDAEKILISLLEQRQSPTIDLSSRVLCLNALSLLILERADVPLFDHLFRLAIGQPNNSMSTLLPLFCANLSSVVKFGFHSKLVCAFIQSLSLIKNVRLLNDLKWQFCAIFAKEPICLHLSNLADKFLATSDDFFEGFVLRLSGQYPLPGFIVSQWNSLPALNGQQQMAEHTTDGKSKDIFMETDGSILSLDKDNNLWCRTHVGRHCYRARTIIVEECPTSNIEEWLNSLASSPEISFNNHSVAASVRKKSSSVGAVIDPFQDLPRPSVRSYSFSTNSNFAQKADSPLFDISGPEMLQFIQSSTRNPEEFGENELMDHKGGGAMGSAGEGIIGNENCLVDGGEEKDGDEAQREWHQFVASFGLLEKAKDPPNNFHREIRHLDSAQCREVHKVAVIYVAKDQQDKQSILSNSNGSESFNRFVDGLGWMVQIGSSDFHGYSGGLPNGQLVPYFCSANTEMIFHVSTLLNGDNTQRLKHLGNDEVHVVWSENTKPYHRDLIATRFCDVLIVLYLASPVLLRVHIEVQDQNIQFGPLFDGACIHILQAASLVRETVLNASRAYRNLRVECDRPNKHREKVFREKKQMLKHLPLASSIIQLYSS